jgi:hypothetical protein
MFDGLGALVTFEPYRMKEQNMKKRIQILVVVTAACATGFAIGQGRLMDMVANKVIAKYQGASCEQLWQQKGAPKTQEEQNAVNFLRNDPTARTAFIDKVAAPIVNKMFECGMVP